MKKILIVVIGLCLSQAVAEAQTWNEWFRQKKTQKKYLIQQIAALKVYLKYLKEGYDVAKKGLGMIGDIKDGNFNDHTNYFESLMLVNPAIRNSNKVALIARYQRQIINEFDALNRECKAGSSLSADEIEYIQDVYANLLSQCENSISELNSIVIDNSSQLKDDERIERIDQIYADMNDKRAFTRAFANSTRMLILQRRGEFQEVRISEKLNQGL